MDQAKASGRQWLELLVEWAALATGVATREFL